MATKIYIFVEAMFGNDIRKLTKTENIFGSGLLCVVLKTASEKLGSRLHSIEFGDFSTITFFHSAQLKR